MASWRLMAHGKQISSKPRIVVLRSIMLNHWYHHRGQLSVYLRLLDVPVPVIYGPSADENPFRMTCGAGTLGRAGSPVALPHEHERLQDLASG